MKSWRDIQRAKGRTEEQIEAGQRAARAELSPCPRCGRLATEVTLDGADSKLVCGEYPYCKLPITAPDGTS